MIILSYKSIFAIHKSHFVAQSSEHLRKYSTIIVPQVTDYQ